MKQRLNRPEEGDLVRPLDEPGEGIVRAFDKAGNVLVEMDGGMLIPYRPSKLVVVGRKETHEQKPGIYSAHEADGSLVLRLSLHTNNQVQISLINGCKEPFLVILYSVEEKIYKLIGNFMLLRQQLVSVCSMDWNALTRIDRFYVRGIALPDKVSFLPDMVSCAIRHHSPQFADTESWPFDESGSYRVYNLPIIPVQNQGVETEVQTPRKIPADKSGRKWMLREGKDGQVEIDLHLHELLESTAGMSNHDKISFQLRHFEKCLDEAIERKMRRLIAIHGVGKGRLRDEIRSLLNARGIGYQDASYQKYGYGATEVRLKA